VLVVDPTGHGSDHGDVVRGRGVGRWFGRGLPEQLGGVGLGGHPQAAQLGHQTVVRGAQVVVHRLRSRHLGLQLGVCRLRLLAAALGLLLGAVRLGHLLVRLGDLALGAVETLLKGAELADQLLPLGADQLQLLPLDGDALGLDGLHGRRSRQCCLELVHLDVQAPQLVLDLLEEGVDLVLVVPAQPGPEGLADNVFWLQRHEFLTRCFSARVITAARRW
jgi:hypothetical protein